MPTSIRDDSVLEEEPSLNADYLAHPWSDEDLWLTRRYILRKRIALESSARLENALWRAWNKKDCPAGTVSPRRINWDKDSDITWLYGPWQRSIPPRPRSPSHPSRWNTTLSENLPKKPALKKTSRIPVQSNAGQIPVSPENRYSPRAVSARNYNSPEFPQKSVSGTALSRLVKSATRCVKFAFDRNPAPAISSRRSNDRIRFDAEVRQCVDVQTTKWASFLGEGNSPWTSEVEIDNLQLPAYDASSKHEIHHQEWVIHPSIEYLPPTTLGRPMDNYITLPSYSS
ncbi:hypothetical protein DTO271G3_5609 [Paecilomyces variotii]|nr:hypothetical protein DTO271G3_5609 [Paecilomyces variotii]